MTYFYSRLGGKSRLRERLYELFPPLESYHTYVEPFFGAGWLFFYKPRSPKEVINDTEKLLYHALKDVQKVSEEDIKTMNFRKSKKRFYELKESNPTTPYQRLYRFLYLTWFSFSGFWDNYAPSKTSQIKRFLNRLPFIQERLKGVVILNQDYSKVIKKYDNPDAFFYLDPPYYETSTRSYTSKTIDVEAFAEMLRRLEGRFLLSYNDHPFIRKTFRDFKMRTIQTRYTIGGEVRHVKELIIQNY